MTEQPKAMKFPFEEIKQTDAEGREWWNSRQLARILGYDKYWNFERLVDKVATYLQRDKGLKLNELIFIRLKRVVKYYDKTSDITREFYKSVQNIGQSLTDQLLSP